MAACQEERHRLHIFFLPFLAPGHMIPMVDMARCFSEHGVNSTIVTTPLNVVRIKPSIDHFNNSSENKRPIQILQIKFPSSYFEPGENLSSFQSPSITGELLASMNSLRKPFEELLEKHRPDAIVSDALHVWSPDSADLFGIPRLVFHGCGTFPILVSTKLMDHIPLDGEVSGEKKFVVPGLHHRIEMRVSELPGYVLNRNVWTDDMVRGFRRSYGVVMNTFADLEMDYIRDGVATSPSSWDVGPLSLCNRGKADMILRGDVISDGFSATCMDWMDSMKPKSVLYVCFGSCGRFTVPQQKEILAGLDVSGYPYIWVVKSGVGGTDPSEWLPDEEKRSKKGLILTGWAPQVLILNHSSIGGFMSHCGWNSCLESIAAGVPMVTWPLFGDQFFNMKFIVDVVKVGVEVGDMVCSEIAEERRVMTRRQIEKAVRRVMDGGDEAVAMRKRVTTLRSLSLKAVEEGGSSFNNIRRLINELSKLKHGKVDQR